LCPDFVGFFLIQHVDIPFVLLRLNFLETLELFKLFRRLLQFESEFRRIRFCEVYLLRLVGYQEFELSEVIDPQPRLDRIDLLFAVVYFGFSAQSQLELKTLKLLALQKLSL